MKEIKSFLAVVGLTSLAFVVTHYLILFLGLNDLTGLILLALPLVAVIAYTTNETLRDMLRSALSIYAWFVSVVLAAAALVWFIG
ncbi:MAG: hypothetical protein O6938_11590 [Gammaproteobacteria bacterium]|nr:hypothetical protein [Gammaproteobacteria bacterium]MCZ6486800.1 hypothetical protein [Gammaproteobacteria bacterium]MCZ6667216.1 hypothetical protein [Gammaproteobacteria bacterium]MCZ6724553.1 hypothetical protein [Gammaproteobacteria bacterium]MCZ6882897.1 hypothetical protein [Gammaproteobacteria bacterium]